MRSGAARSPGGTRNGLAGPARERAGREGRARRAVRRSERTLPPPRAAGPRGAAAHTEPTPELVRGRPRAARERLRGGPGLEDARSGRARERAALVSRLRDPRGPGRGWAGSQERGGEAGGRPRQVRARPARGRPRPGWRGQQPRGDRRAGVRPGARGAQGCSAEAAEAGLAGHLPSEVRVRPRVGSRQPQGKPGEEALPGAEQGQDARASRRCPGGSGVGGQGPGGRPGRAWPLHAPRARRVRRDAPRGLGCAPRRGAAGGEAPGAAALAVGPQLALLRVLGRIGHFLPVLRPGARRGGGARAGELLGRVGPPRPQGPQRERGHLRQRLLPAQRVRRGAAGGGAGGAGAQRHLGGREERAHHQVAVHLQEGRAGARPGAAGPRVTGTGDPGQEASLLDDGDSLQYVWMAGTPGPSSLPGFV